MHNYSHNHQRETVSLKHTVPIVYKGDCEKILNRWYTQQNIPGKHLYVQCLQTISHSDDDKMVWCECDLQPSQTHNHEKNMTTMGKADTLDFMNITLVANDLVPLLSYVSPDFVIKNV